LDLVKIDNFIKVRSILDIEGIGIIKLLRLTDIFGSIDNIYKSDNIKLRLTEILNSDLANKIANTIHNFNSIKEEYKKEIDNLIKFNVQVITYWDENYPPQLKNIFIHH